MKAWLVKIRRYDGSESVIISHNLKELAECDRDRWNANYQSDQFYIEEYDPAKMTGWSLPTTNSRRLSQ